MEKEKIEHWWGYNFEKAERRDFLAKKLGRQKTKETFWQGGSKREKGLLNIRWVGAWKRELSGKKEDF